MVYLAYNIRFYRIVTHLPSTRQLRYFIALVRHGHFGRAAEVCFVSPSTFSSAIRELEVIVDCGLVDRTNKRVTITNQGREFARQAEAVIKQMEEMIDQCSSVSKPLHGPLHLGVIPTIAPFMLPSLLPKLRGYFPELQLFLHEDQSALIHQQLLDGRLDLMLLALPYTLPGCESLTLFDDPFLLARHKDSNTLNSAPFTIEKLPSESILLLKDGHCLRDHALSACRIDHVEKVSKVSANSLLTLVEMVDAGLGVTFLPQMVQESNLLNHTEIELLPLQGDSFRQIGIAWRRGSQREGEFQLLGEKICQIWSQH